MNELDKLQHEIIKSAHKIAVMNNPKLTQYQKQYAVDKLDETARKADWIEAMMKQCGYIK